MLRWLIELLVTFILAMAARAILGSVMKNFSGVAQRGFQDRSNNQAQPDQQSPPPSPRQPQERVTVAGELHKDPVCGMYVAESTAYKRKLGRDTIYYCSDKCKEQHAVTVKA